MGLWESWCELVRRWFQESKDLCEHNWGDFTSEHACPHGAYFLEETCTSKLLLYPPKRGTYLRSWLSSILERGRLAQCHWIWKKVLRVPSDIAHLAVCHYAGIIYQHNPARTQICRTVKHISIESSTFWLSNTYSDRHIFVNIQTQAYPCKHEFVDRDKYG